MLSQRKNKLLTFRMLAVNMLLLMTAFLMVPLGVAQAAATQPTVTAIGVIPSEQVQVRIDNLPADTDFTVTESAVGNQGVGSVIAHFNSGTGGTRIYWFEILTNVNTDAKVELRIDNGSGIFAYTTFDNTTPVTSGTTTTTTTTAATTTPVISPVIMGVIHVVHVQKGGIVVAELTGLPLDTQFTVTVGTGGSQGFDGFKVGNLSSEGLSDHIGSFEIPVDLSGEKSLDLRIDAPGYLYLVTFANTNF